jgi:hypothetical protein
VLRDESHISRLIRAARRIARGSQSHSITGKPGDSFLQLETDRPSPPKLSVRQVNLSRISRPLLQCRFQRIGLFRNNHSLLNTSRCFETRTFVPTSMTHLETRPCTSMERCVHKLLSFFEISPESWAILGALNYSKQGDLLF